MACHMEYYHQILNDVTKYCILIHLELYACKFGIAKFMSLLLWMYIDIRMYVHLCIFMYVQQTYVF